MHTIRSGMIAGAALFIGAAAADAQMPQRTAAPRSSAGTPVASVPAGMCRIWIDGMPATRQPAPTDCATARARVPANGRVIYGGSVQQPVYGSNGQYDPRAARRGQYDPRDSRRSQYDPRRDTRSSQYDPRLDRTSGRYDRRYDDDYSRKQAKIRAQYLKKQQHEREKYERRMQKEQEKQWKKSHDEHWPHDEH